MAFSRTWDSSYEALPPDTVEQAVLGASRIRQVKIDVRERLSVDHSWLGDSDDGKHKQVTLTELEDDPVTVASEGYLYTKDVEGIAELFFKDSAGNSQQLTSNGSLTGGEIPTGTVMAFFQEAAPTGWTQVVTENDKLLRVVSGTGGGTGGDWEISGLSIDGHALLENELPPHRHFIAADIATTSTTVITSTSQQIPKDNTWGSNDPTYRFVGTATDATIGRSSEVGGGQSHDHNLSADGNWRPEYIDMIICSKD